MKRSHEHGVSPSWLLTQEERNERMREHAQRGWAFWCLSKNNMSDIGDVHLSFSNIYHAEHRS